MIVLILFGVPVVLGYHFGLGLASWALGLIAAGAWYIRDVKRHPVVRCRVCSGGGDEKSRLGGSGWFRRPFGNCWCCGGKKVHPRPALRFLDAGKYRKIQAEVRQAKGKT